MIYARGGRASIDPTAYPDLEQFWSDIIAAYAEELRRLGDLGCRYLQFDDTSLAMLADPSQRERIAARGDDADHLHMTFIRRLNEVIAQKPQGMAITTHTCRGNYRSAYSASGGYDFVAEALFSELAVDGFFVEWDDERSGGFEPLRFVPKGKTVVLGLVTTKTGELETKDEIKRRVEEASSSSTSISSAFPAVRVRLDARGQRALAAAADGEAAAGGRDRAGDLGLSAC